MYYKVAANTELENTEPLLLVEILILVFLWPLVTIFFIKLPIYTFFFSVCFCLKTCYLIYIVDTYIEFMTNSTITHA